MAEKKTKAQTPAADSSDQNGAPDLNIQPDPQADQSAPAPESEQQAEPAAQFLSIPQIAKLLAFVGKPASEQQAPPVQEAGPEPARATDKTLPGGLYIIDGKVVNANGQPLAGWAVVNGHAVKGE